MPLYRCELLFNEGQRGWTEKYARFRNTPKDAANFPLLILNKLMAFRSTTVQLYAIRASNPLVPGDEYLRVWNVGGARAGVDNDVGPDQPPASAMVRTISDNNHKGMMYLRGLADHDVQIDPANGRSAPSDFLAGCIRSLADSLVNDATFGMEMPTPVTSAGFGWKQIFSVAPQGANPAQTVVTLAQPITNIIVPPGDGDPAGIIIRGIDQRLFPALQGIFRVVATNVAKDQLTIFYTWRSNSQTHQPPRAYARPYRPFFSGFSEYVFQRFVVRKTGLPTVRSRGRRRAGVSRR